MQSKIKIDKIMQRLNKLDAVNKELDKINFNID